MRYAVAFAIGGIGGWIFSLIHMPLPWTLGPLAAVIIIKIYLKYNIVWPGQLRNIAMAVLGYAMGRSFTPETGQRILGLLPYLITASLILVLLSLVVGSITSRFTGVNLTSSLFGSIPGGLSQMATICENMQDADVSVITFMQTIRMLVVVFIIPFVAIHGLSRNSAPLAAVPASLRLEDVMQLALFTCLISILLYLSKYLKVTGRFVVVPIIGTAVLVLSGINAPSLPSPVIKIAQVFVGIRMGSSVNVTNLKNWKKISVYSVLGNLGLLVTLFGVDYIFVQFAPISFLTAFIAIAPGGMTEMGLTAMTVKADLPTVISFQLFRLLFILLVAIPLLSRWLRHYLGKTGSGCRDTVKNTLATGEDSHARSYFEDD